METRKLGSDAGPKISRVGLGCNNLGSRLDAHASRRVVHAALNNGITFFDTADVYSDGLSESYLGKALGAIRPSVLVATKFGYTANGLAGAPGPASRHRIVASVNASLRRLDSNWIDLFQLHRPDDSTPWHETLRALDDLVRSGKVRFVGASNLSASQIAEANSVAQVEGTARFLTHQHEYSVLRRAIESQTLPAVRLANAKLIPFFPLANGLLTGKHSRGAAAPTGSRLSKPGRWTDEFLTEQHLLRVSALEQFAVIRGHSLLELAMSWLAGQDDILCVIAGASNASQVTQNVQAANWRMSAIDRATIDQICNEAITPQSP